MVICAVPGCNFQDVSIRFPTDKKRRKAWSIAIRRVDPENRGKLWTPTKHSRLCKRHFKAEDFKPLSWAAAVAGITQRKLRKDVIPSLLIPGREMAVTRRQRRNTPSCRPVEDASAPDVGNEVVVTETGEMDQALCDEEVTKTVDQSSQTDTETAHQASQTGEMGAKYRGFSVENFHDKPKMIQHYTGFSSYAHFIFVFNLLQHDSSHGLQYHRYPSSNNGSSSVRLLSPEDCLFLTLVKLKINLPDIELAGMFDISETMVSSVFRTWLSLMYYSFKDLDFASSTDSSADVTMIIDCTEIKIAKPSDPIAQQATYSTYKQANTVKVLVGVTPGGMVTFVSEAYGGAYSDRAVFDKCGVLNVLKPGDTVLADRGFMIEDLLEARGIVLNVPASLRGKSRLLPSERRRSQYISTRRIHVERAIGLAKTYAIISRVMHKSVVTLSSYIIYVCFMLTNFRKNIMMRQV